MRTLSTLSIPSMLALGLAWSACSSPAQPTTTHGDGRAPEAIGAALDRSVLPIPEPPRRRYTELDVRKAQAPARWEVKAPAGAPNVVVVLIDDMGFGVTHPFGGPPLHVVCL